MCISHIRRSTLFVRKSTFRRKVIGIKCVGRCEFVSSRVEEGHLTFPSCVSFVEAICGVERHSAPSAGCKKKIALECFCLIWCEEYCRRRISENDVVDRLP